MNKIKTNVQELIAKIPDNIKVKLISAWNTFIAAFLTVISATIAAGSVQFSQAFLLALLIAAMRAGVKAVIDTFVPVRLGGVK